MLSSLTDGVGWLVCFPVFFSRVSGSGFDVNGRRESRTRGSCVGRATGRRYAKCLQSLIDRLVMYQEVASSGRRSNALEEYLRTDG